MSNSKTWRRRKQELYQKEQILLEDLNLKSTRTKKIVLWSLGSGILTLAGYMIYNAFNQEPAQKKKEKTKSISEDLPIVDMAIENLGPSLGKWLLKQVKK